MTKMMDISKTLTYELDWDFIRSDVCFIIAYVDGVSKIISNFEFNVPKR